MNAVDISTMIVFLEIEVLNEKSKFSRVVVAESVRFHATIDEVVLRLLSSSSISRLKNSS